MQLHEAILRRCTTNGHFEDRPVTLEHQHRLVEAASRAPSHFNSQPWRFILITDPGIRDQVAQIAGRTMEALMAGGKFFARYRRYFRFSQDELAQRGDGILIDKMPGPLRPFARQILSPTGEKLLNKLGIPRMLGQDNAKLVGGSPLMLAALLDRDEYRPGQLSGLYSLLGLGMAIENIWLTTVELGMGIQFVSTPMEFPEAWQELRSVLSVPDTLELVAVYRLGYVPRERRRPSIDWVSRHRKRLDQYVFRNTCMTPEPAAGAESEDR